MIRNLVNIGEAVKNLSDDLRSRAPEIPWRQIAGMRDRLVHAYFTVDLDLVYEVIESEMPRLENRVRALLDVSKNEQEQ